MKIPSRGTLALNRTHLAPSQLHVECRRAHLIAGAAHQASTSNI
jgi:hypothetical protein